VVRLNYAGRMELISGVVEIAPGISVHPAPGHTAGLQVVRVSTARGGWCSPPTPAISMKT